MKTGKGFHYQKVKQNFVFKSIETQNSFEQKIMHVARK